MASTKKKSRHVLHTSFFQFFLYKYILLLCSCFHSFVGDDLAVQIFVIPSGNLLNLANSFVYSSFYTRLLKEVQHVSIKLFPNAQKRCFMNAQNIIIKSAHSNRALDWSIALNLVVESSRELFYDQPSHCNLVLHFKWRLRWHRSNRRTGNVWSSSRVLFTNMRSNSIERVRIWSAIEGCLDGCILMKS